MNYLRGFSLNAVSTGLVFALGLANQSLLARGLGSEGYGRLALWSSTVAIAALLLGEWFNRGSTYVMGRSGQRAPVVTGGLLYALLLVPLLPALLLWAGPTHIPIPGLTTGLLLLLAGLILCTFLQKAGEAVLLGEDRIRLYSAVPVVFIGGWLLGNVIALGGEGPATLAPVLWAWLVAAAAAALLAWACLVSGVAVLRRPDPAVVARIAAVGGRAAVAVVLVFLMFRIDFYLVEYFLGSAELGVYRAAAVVAEMMQRLPNVAGAVLLPKVIAGSGSGRDRLTLRVAAATLAFSLSATAVILLFGQGLIEIVFGAPYAGALRPLVWMLPGLVLAGFGSICNTRLAGSGYPPVTWIAPALALGVDVALNVVWIPRYGLVGAAAATSVAYGLWSVLVTVAYGRRLLADRKAQP